MKHVFLIFGYGVPKNIMDDDNYRVYVRTAFNTIFDIAAKNNIHDPLIICAGGKTDCYKPYKRTEAEEMIRLMKTFVQIPALKKKTKSWKFIPEKKSLSTVENFLYCKEDLQKRNIFEAHIHVFCEYTRGKRLQTLSKKVFQNPYRVQMLPIDFDSSPNRYLEPSFIEEKEKKELAHCLWALKNEENLKKHHSLLEEKLVYLRNAGPHMHTEAVRTWWEKN